MTITHTETFDFLPNEDMLRWAKLYASVAEIHGIVPNQKLSFDSNSPCREQAIDLFGYFDKGKEVYASKHGAGLIWDMHKLYVEFHMGYYLRLKYRIHKEEDVALAVHDFLWHKKRKVIMRKLNLPNMQEISDECPVCVVPATNPNNQLESAYRKFYDWLIEIEHNERKWFRSQRYMSRTTQDRIMVMLNSAGNIASRDDDSMMARLSVYIKDRFRWNYSHSWAVNNRIYEIWQTSVPPIFT